MTPLHEWLKPPRSLLLYLFLLTLASVSALSWCGWKLLTQERMVEAQHVEERLERAADRTGHEIIGAISLKHLYEIAALKRRDTPNIPLEAICKNLMASCRSMGVKVVARPEDA